MSADPARSQPPQRQSSSTRIEYLDCHSASDYREYRLALHTVDGAAEVRFRIANAAFTSKHVLLQDGPDLCYQRLLRMLAAGEVPGPGVLTIDETELAAYRDAHTPTPRRSAAPRPAARPASVQRARPGEARPKLPVAAARPAAAPEPAFDEGQRVSHAVYGTGVTKASNGAHTSVHFDEHGLRTFVTSLLKLEPLSAPHEWETGPRGKNRRREDDPPRR